MSVTGIALDDWVAQGKVFRYRGHQIRWWEAGAGEPLLLIHGFPSGSWDWHYLWQALAERYRVIALDMIGFAFSDKPQHYPYSLLDQADLQQALMGSLDIAEYHVLAHDYGDSVAQELLARHEVQFEIIRGHSGHPENERCDELAVEAALKFAE